MANSIKITGKSNGHRFQIFIDNQLCLLTPKSLDYIILMAISRIRLISGWIYKDDIEPGFNQARYIYRLKQEISEFILDESKDNPEIIENDRKGSYRLNVDRVNVTIDFDSFKNYPNILIRDAILDLERIYERKSIEIATEAQIRDALRIHHIPKNSGNLSDYENARRIFSDASLNPGTYELAMTIAAEHIGV